MGKFRAQAPRGSGGKSVWSAVCEGLRPMIPALKTSRPAVSIQVQPANDGDPRGTSDIPLIAGIVRHEPRRWPEHLSWQKGLTVPREGRSLVAGRHEALLQELGVEEAERCWIRLQPGEVACRIHAFRDQYW